MPRTADSVLSLTAQIVIAQIESHDIPAHALPGLVKDVYEALASAGSSTRKSAAAVPARTDRRTTIPEASIQSSSDELLMCQECGMRMKMLKRHLLTVHDMTPARYRAKWGLPADCPLVTPRYAALRSRLAKASGLGKRHAD